MEGARAQYQNSAQFNSPDYSYTNIGGARKIANILIMNALKHHNRGAWQDVKKINEFLQPNYLKNYVQDATNLNNAIKDKKWNGVIGDLQSILR